MKRIHIANPDEKKYAENRWLFAFGAYGSTHVLVYQRSIEDALEIAAGYLAEQELWGLITPHEAPKEDLGCDCANPFECDAHTYTESGWLTSWEWFVAESPTNQDLINLHKSN